MPKLTQTDFFKKDGFSQYDFPDFFEDSTFFTFPEKNEDSET